MPTDAKYYNAFNLIHNIGPVKFKKLYTHFTDLGAAWKAGKTELTNAGLDEKTCDNILASRPQISPDAEWEKLEKNKISVLTIKDANFPKLLREIYAPPAILYIKGTLNGIIDFPIAVVGPRKMSQYGKRVTEDIVSGLAASGVTIISGMSLGIDIAAHETAIKNNGRTVAVLASGLDPANLSARKYIGEKIMANGALISEYPFGKPAMKHQFPIRNRIVSGLSLGVLVIEAAERSGSLITAQMALEQNRLIFTVPGSIYWPSSAGSNNLIKKGAQAITGAEEILEALNLTKIENYTINKRIASATPEEKKICAILGVEPLHIDTIARNAKINSSETSSLLMLMEMKGMVKNLGSGNYTIPK